MKIFIALLLAIFGATSHAAWKLSEVVKSGTIVGYVYHTDSLGTRTSNLTSKHITGLRIVCSVNIDDPLIIIFWEGMMGYGEYALDIRVDGSTNFGMPYRWVNDGNIMIRRVNESAHILQTFRTASKLLVSWVSNDGALYQTVFDLSGFNNSYSSYLDKCKAK